MDTPPDIRDEAPMHQSPGNRARIISPNTNAITAYSAMNSRAWFCPTKNQRTPNIRVTKTSATCLPRCKKIKTNGKGDKIPTNAPRGGITTRTNKSVKTRTTSNSAFCSFGPWSKTSAKQKKAARRYYGLF